MKLTRTERGFGMHTRDSDSHEHSGRGRRLPARCAYSLAAVSVFLFLATPKRALTQECVARQVPRRELLEAMQLHGDYDIVATTNRGRFASELLLQLARWAKQRAPDGDPFYINPDDWFFAYLQTAGLGLDEAPIPSLLGLRHGQRVQVDYRPDRVIREVAEGPRPLLAVNVRAWWPEAEGSPSKFSFTDTAATPKLKVTSHREIRYRLLEFEDMVVLDKIEGLSGRPVSGLLGLLFDIIGEGSLKESRIAISKDGLQIFRGRSKKIFSLRLTATIYPDGRGIKGIPEDRPDLKEIEARLKAPLKIEYLPYECGADQPVVLIGEGTLKVSG